MRFLTASTVLALLVISAPSLVAGQGTPARSSRLLQAWRPDRSLLLSPAAPGSGLGAFRSQEDARAPLAVARIGHGGRKEAVALMIVGGAGIITGLLVDEGIITIAGAGVAGVGLYLYLR